MSRRRLLLAAVCCSSIVAMAPFTSATSAASATDSPGGGPTCGDAVTTIDEPADASLAKQYLLRPFTVPAGTKQVEVGYSWDPVDAGVVDLGVWDQRGTSGRAAFRTWSGSRQGRLDKHMPPEVVTTDRNERTVVPGPVGAGVWHVELGIAAVSQPFRIHVEIRCPSGTPGPALAPDRVDPTHVARTGAGWYAGDFHLHAFHSNPDGPEPDAMVAAARLAGLDIVPVTEYVTPAHWNRLGAVQRANPDLLVWPGREVITYYGHMIVLSETSGVEYRVGLAEGGRPAVTFGDIQRSAAADGALVSLAHPTIFPPKAFGSACRGCFFEQLDQVDWPSVTAMEVVTEGATAELNGSDVPNPFVRTAIELWESQLRAGHRVTAISGSDDKLGDKYGKTSTMVYAKQLSRAAVDEAIRRGHAYVRGLGTLSPTIDVTATVPGGATAMMGDTLVADRATMQVTVRGGSGDTLAIRRNGSEVERRAITADPFTTDVAIDRTVAGGPLGTFWGVEVLDTTRAPGAELPVDVANPIFLADHARPAPVLPHFRKPVATPTPGARMAPAAATTDTGTAALVAGAIAVVAVVGAGALVRRRWKGRPE